MAAAKIIKQLLLEQGKSVADLAQAFGIKPQSMSNKLYRDNFSYDEVVKIADMLDCDVAVVTRSTGKIFK